MRCSKVRMVAGAVGLAMCAVAVAENVDPRVSFQRMTESGLAPLPQKNYDSRLDRLVPAGETTIDMTAVGSVSRGTPNLRGPGVIAMTDDLEAAMILPANPDFQTTTPVWTETVPGTPDGDVSEWQGQVTPFAGFVNDAIGGNATIKARVFTSAAQPPDLFFFGMTFDMFADFAGDVPLVLTPDASNNVRLESEMFVAALSTVFSNEPIDGQSGFISSRVLWGGTCGGDGTDCTEFGLPNCFPGGGNTDPSCTVDGLLKDFYVLGPNPNSFTTGIFIPCTYIGSAPPGSSVGDRVEVPVGQWVTMAHESTDTGEIIHKIDFQDGNGSFDIYSGVFITGTRFGAWGSNSSLEGASDATYFDNFGASGIEFVFPTPPLLECDYTDNMEWLNPGQLAGQGNRWFDALSSRASVVANGVGPSQAIRQTNNVVSNNAYREEFSTELPETIATSSPYSICADIRTTSFTATVRGFTPTSNSFGSFVTRVFIGRDDGSAYDNNVYIQTNPDYQPIDDEDCGPSGDCFVADSGDATEGGVPGIGTDVDNTGFMWPHDNSFRELCVNVSNDGSMTVEVGGANIYNGSTLNNTIGIDELRNESENNAGGPGDAYTVDNVVLTCSEAPEVVLPPLTFIYLDNTDWGIVNVPVGAHEEVGAGPMDLFRWGSDAEVIIANDTFRGSADLLIQMENTDLDQNLVDNDANTDGLIDIDQKALTELPERIVNASTGWVAGSSVRMSDFTTTRFLRPLANSIFQDQFVVDTSIAIEANTQQLWIQMPNGVDMTMWSPLGVTMADLGIGADEWFEFRVARNPAGNFTYRFNNVLLRDGSGNVVQGLPLQSTDNGTHENLGGFTWGAGSEDTATPGSTMWIDDVRAHTLPCGGDVNGDGNVNFTDLNVILAQFGNDEAIDGPQAGNINDANGDGIPDDALVNFTDLNVLLSGFGTSCD